MHHQNPTQVTTPMLELIRLNKAIDTILKDYLRHRFGVTTETIKTRTLEDIIYRLRLNPHHFKELNAAQLVPQDVSTYGKVKNALVYGIQYVDKTVRFYANTDGVYRLDTLAWLCWSLRNFEKYLTKVELLSAATDSNSLKADLEKDSGDFLDAITRILTTLPDTKSAFILARERKKFVIYGLKEDPSELSRLFRDHILDEFDRKNLIRGMRSDIERKATSLAKVQLERVEEKKQVQQLEENNADLHRQLEASHNSVQQLKNELLNSRERTLTIDTELLIKRSQESAFERRIARLEKDKLELEGKQSQLDKSSLSISHLQSEIDSMRKALEMAEAERNAVIQEKEELLSREHSEQIRQSEIQQQLSDAHSAKTTLTDRLDQPVTNDDDMYQMDNAYEGDDLGEDEIDLAMLTSKLKQYEQNRQVILATKHSEEPSIVDNQQSVFPGFDDEYENGLTWAQVLALQCQAGYLKALLKRDPGLVNKICKSDFTNPLSNKSPLELVLFDSKANLKARKETLAVILSYRPDITSQEGRVFSDIKVRLEETPCHADMCEMFCEYVVAKRTCSVESLDGLRNEMTIIEGLVDKLLEMGADADLRKISLPLTVCRALRFGYINGSFSKATPFIEGEKLADHAMYEIFYDEKMRRRIEEQYQRKYGAPLLRTDLISKLKDMYRNFLATTRGVSIIAKRDDTKIPLSETEVAAFKNGAPSRVIEAKSSIVSQALPPVDFVKLFSELVTHLTFVIDRYGVILNSKGFNAYQRAEIALKILSSDQDMTPQVVEEFRQTLHK